MSNLIFCNPTLLYPPMVCKEKINIILFNGFVESVPLFFDIFVTNGLFFWGIASNG